jgi:predicted site-specific integrase-resolvase
MVAKLLTAEQVAQVLGVKPDTLAAWRCRRTVPLPFVKVGKRVMYDEDDLAEFINRNKRL